MANNDKENKIKKFTKEAIGKTLNQFNKEIGIADLVEINKNQDRILNGILSQVNDENTEKTEKSNIITLDNSTDGIVELKEIQGDTNVNVSKIEEMPITHDIGDKEGNVFTLNEIPKGAISIGEIQGNTMVNCNKDDKKELVLMKDLSTEGYSNITLNKGVDGGLVDVALEGNTMVNVCDQKDPVAITKAYTVETGNHVALQGEYDGKCRPVVTGNTLWIDNATEEVLTAFDDTKNLRLQSSFEDKVVTQEMVDAGKELAENLGKYKVDYVISKEDGTTGQTKTFYLNSPLLEGDTIEQQGDNVVHVHRSELRAYETDDELTLPTDMTNTLVAKATPQYEVISTNDTILCDSYVNGHLDIDSVVPIEKVVFNRTNLRSLKYLYPNTEYTIQFESDNVGKIQNIYIGSDHKQEALKNVAKGINKVNITLTNTQSNTFPYFSWDGIGFNASNIVVTPAIDQDFGYFEGMKSVGECEDLEVMSSNSDGTLSNTQTLTHEPLRAVGDIKDKYVLIDGKWYIERKCGVRAYQEGDIDNYITDKINTVYPLLTPQYEPINYNPFTVYSDTTHISNNSTIPCNMTIKNTGYNCLLKPSTTYTVSSNLGLNTVTTPSTLTEDCLRFYDTDTSDVTTMKNVTVLEGDYTTGKPIPSHFSGIESAFEQEYDETVGKYKVKIRVQNEDASKENYIEFYINEPLRGIGDTKDKVYVKNDKVVVERKCGSVTFDGSEDEGWVLEGAVNGRSQYYIEKNDVFKTTDYTKIMKCDKLNVNKQHYTGYGISGYGNPQAYPNQNWIYILTQIEDVVKLRQWLQQNPTTVVYQLAEPQYEEIEYSESRLFLNTYNNSTLFYESNIPVSNTSFKPLWEELVYLKNFTKYYIQFNSTASGTVVFNLGGTEVTKDIVEGYNNIAIDTPARTTNLLTIDGHGIKISEVIISESVCGGHYLGLQSCFEEHMENGKYVCTIRGIALDGSKVNGIKLYINEPLRGIEGIKDRLCIKDGKLMVERNCGSVTLDGSEDEDWAKTNDFEGISQYCSQLPKDSPDKIIKCIYDLPYYTIVTLGDKIYAVKNIATLDEFKQWLQQNPTTVVYQLATPVYEEVTNEYGLPIVLEGYENGIVYIDSVVIPTTSIKYTSNNQLATTLSETEGKNSSTQDDINMNVVTYMMDIDMLLTEMEMSNDISVMAVRRDNSNENMLDRMSEEDKKVYRDNTVVMLEKMITAKALEKEDIEGRINMYYNKNRISKEQYKYLKSLL